MRSQNVPSRVAFSKSRIFFSVFHHFNVVDSLSNYNLTLHMVPQQPNFPRGG